MSYGTKQPEKKNPQTPLRTIYGDTTPKNVPKMPSAQEIRNRPNMNNLPDSLRNVKTAFGDAKDYAKSYSNLGASGLLGHYLTKNQDFGNFDINVPDMRVGYNHPNNKWGMWGEFENLEKNPGINIGFNYEF